jgi:hypothetical protein
MRGRLSWSGAISHVVITVPMVVVARHAGRGVPPLRDDLGLQSFAPALVWDLWWLYLSAVVGGVLMVIYGFITLSDVLSGRGPRGELVK